MTTTTTTTVALYVDQGALRPTVAGRYLTNQDYVSAVAAGIPVYWSKCFAWMNRRRITDGIIPLSVAEYKAIITNEFGE